MLCAVPSSCSNVSTFALQRMPQKGLDTFRHATGFEKRVHLSASANYVDFEGRDMAPTPGDEQMKKKATPNGVELQLGLSSFPFPC